MAAIWMPESFITTAGSTPLSWAIGMAVMLLLDGPLQKDKVITNIMYVKREQSKYKCSYFS